MELVKPGHLRVAIGGPPNCVIFYRYKAHRSPIAWQEEVRLFVFCDSESLLANAITSVSVISAEIPLRN